MLVGDVGGGIAGWREATLHGFEGRSLWRLSQEVGEHWYDLDRW